MIDTHAHIYLNDFDPDRGLITERAQKAGISGILLPNIDTGSIEAMLRTEQQYPGFCKAMMGLHPTSVKTDYRDQLSVMEQWLNRRRFIGIGEIGMDLYWDKTYLEEQKEVLAIQLRWAMELDLPVAIHTRDAFPDIFEVFNKVYDARLKGVFHSFSGSLEDAEKILSMPGFYLGINGVVTFKKSHLPDLLAQTGVDRLVLETDAPYLTPVPHRGKRNEPAYMAFTRDKIAEIAGLTPREVDKITSDNAEKLFR